MAFINEDAGFVFFGFLNAADIICGKCHSNKESDSYIFEQQPGCVFFAPEEDADETGM